MLYLAHVRDDENESAAVRMKAASDLIASAMKYRRLDPSPSFRPTLADLDKDLMDLTMDMDEPT